MKLIITNRQNKIEWTEAMEKIIIDSIEQVLKNQGIVVETEVSMILVDNEQICELNQQFRNIDRETDVLSFPMLEGVEDFNDLIEESASLDINEQAVLLGDIALSLEKAKEQSIEYGHSLFREVSYLTVHSVLHLLGFDHMEEEDKKIMRGIEEEVMNELGLPRGEADETGK